MMNAKYPLNKIAFVMVSLVLICVVIYFTTNHSSYERGNKQQLTKITLRLIWYAQTQFAGYYVAKDMGYYEDEGLDVDIVPSIGAGDIPSVVGNNYFQFGLTTLVNLMKSLDRGIPVVGISQIVQESNLALLTHKSSGLDRIAKFRGKTLSTWWGKEDYMSKMLVEMNGLEQNELIILDETYWSAEPFLDGRADVAIAMLYNEYNQFIDKYGLVKDDLNVFAFKDYGLNFPEDTLFTSLEMVRHYPDICLKFLRATLKGWHAAFREKDMAVRTVLKYANDTTYDHQMQQLMTIEKAIVTPYENYRGVGHVDNEKIQEVVNILYKNGIINKSLELDDIFNVTFIDDCMTVSVDEKWSIN